MSLCFRAILLNRTAISSWLSFDSLAVCDFRLPSPHNWGLRSSAMLHSVDWKLGTKFSGQLIGPVFKGQSVPWPVKIVSIGCPETSAANYISTLRNIAEDRRSPSQLLVTFLDVPVRPRDIGVSWKAWPVLPRNSFPVSEVLLLSVRGTPYFTFKADLHIQCRAHVAPMPFPRRSLAMPCR